MSAVRDDLSGVQEHVDAMLEASSPAEAVAVLASALRAHLGGQRLHCTVHGVADLTFAELVNHSRLQHHNVGDVIPAEPDPRELGRAGMTKADL